MIPLLLLLTSLLSVQDPDRTPERTIAWAAETGEKLRAFLPKHIAGLEHYMPWDVEMDETPNSGCPIGCTKYTQAVLERTFVVADAPLIAAVAAAEKRAEVTAGKVVADPMNQALGAAMRKVEEEVETLKRSARRGQVEIRVNGTPKATWGMEKAGTPAGTIAGYPVYRFAFSDSSYDPTPVGIRLAVVIGSPDFTNPDVQASQMLGEVKTILVSARVQTREPHVKNDEALIRKLLETVNYAELAKLK